MELREAIARALAKADGKDPDLPAWVEGYGARERTFGICWRDQYGEKADAILALPEIREALAYMEAVDSAHPVLGEIREMLDRSKVRDVEWG